MNTSDYVQTETVEETPEEYEITEQEPPVIDKKIQLERLEEMRRNGEITEEEYTLNKIRLLGG